LHFPFLAFSPNASIVQISRIIVNRNERIDKSIGSADGGDDAAHPKYTAVAHSYAMNRLRYLPISAEFNSCFEPVII